MSLGSPVWIINIIFSWTVCNFSTRHIRSHSLRQGIHDTILNIIFVYNIIKPQMLMITDILLLIFYPKYRCSCCFFFLMPKGLLLKGMLLFSQGNSTTLYRFCGDFFWVKTLNCYFSRSVCLRQQKYYSEMRIVAYDVE